jgi:hypothetical protein
MTSSPADGASFAIWLEPMALNGSLLNVVDDVTRDCLAANPDMSISGTAWRGT